MKLAILSASAKCYSTRRLREAAELRGHRVRVLNTNKFAIDLKKGSPNLFFLQKQLSSYDAVLPRIGASITDYGTAVVRQIRHEVGNPRRRWLVVLHRQILLLL